MNRDEEQTTAAGIGHDDDFMDDARNEEGVPGELLHCSDGELLQRYEA